MTSTVPTAPPERAAAVATPDVAAPPATTPLARAALVAILASTLALAAAYASAFLPGGAPAWAPWLLVIALPVMLVAVMLLGAVRTGGRLGTLRVPFAIVGLMLLAGLVLALDLPATERAGMALWLGLPPRAAIVLYGIGLLPIVILPVAYALTFETQTLRPEDLERVREAGRRWREARR